MSNLGKNECKNYQCLVSAFIERDINLAKNIKEDLDKILDNLIFL